MRITDNYISRLFNRNLNTNMEKLANLQEKIASGKNINRPSDDPVQTIRLLEINNRIAYNEQYNKNIGEGSSLLQFTQEAISNCLDVMDTVYDIALKGADVAVGADERASMAFQIDQQIQELIDISAQKYQDKYVFGGARTTDKPYQAYTTITNEAFTVNSGYDSIQLTHSDIRKSDLISVRDANGQELEIGKDYALDYEQGIITVKNKEAMTPGAYTISYQTYDVNFDVEKIEGVDANIRGINQYYYQEIDDGIKIAMNLPGSEVFEGDVDIFQTLIDLRESLSQNDQEAVNGSLKDVQTGIQQLTNANALAGAKLQRLDLTSDRLTNNKLTLQQQKSGIEDIDVAMAALQLQQFQNVYQAAAYACQTIFDSSLIRFLS
ncbi:MAG: flagellar hook-associated protein FlgL [Candidatus Delongbacteria bacterium]|nr:flagellar hook-associated protein FlgL [Candidatus Delongbacteria bacterium]